MKRLIILCVCLLLTGAQALGEAGQPPSRDAQKLLVLKALSLCQTADACADDPLFARLYTADEAVQQELLKIGAQDWTAPGTAALYVIRDKLFHQFLAASSVELDSLSGPVREKLVRNIPASLSTLVNSVYGSPLITAASLLTNGKVFLSQGLDVPEYCLLHLTFGGDYEALCAFTVSEGVIVSAQMTPVKAGGMDWLLWQLTLSGVRKDDLFESYPIDLTD